MASCAAVSILAPAMFLAPLSLPIPHLSGNIPVPNSAPVSYSIDTHRHTEAHPPWTVSHISTPSQPTPASLVSSWCSTWTLHRLSACVPGCWSGHLKCLHMSGLNPHPTPPPGSTPPPGASSALICTSSVISTCCFSFIIPLMVLMFFKKYFIF